MKRRPWHVAGVLLVGGLLTLSLFTSSPTEAAVFSSSYTYVADGKELPVGVDPVSLNGNLLVPSAMLEQLNVTVESGVDGTVTLSRSGTKITMKLGSQIATQNDESVMLSSAPFEVMGYVYVPEDTLNPLGISVSDQSGLMLVESWPYLAASSMTTSDYARLWDSKTSSQPIYLPGDQPVRVEVTRLTEEMISAPQWSANPFLRGQVRNLLKNGLALQVTLINNSEEIISFGQKDFFLVNHLGKQYQPTSGVIDMNGDLFGELAPAATATAVMCFPLPGDQDWPLQFYLRTSGDLESIAVIHQ